jgi:hypothetical protein
MGGVGRLGERSDSAVEAVHREQPGNGHSDQEQGLDEVSATKWHRQDVI